MSKNILHFQIDLDTNVCVGVSELKEEVSVPNMIVVGPVKDMTSEEIEVYYNRIGQTYIDGSWVEV